jgi:hypothetical protein
MRYFMTIMGILITLMFLLAILAGSAQAGEAVPHPAKDIQPLDASPMIYLALVGGTTALAAFVWMGMLRRVQKPTLNDGETG